MMAGKISSESQNKKPVKEKANSAGIINLLPVLAALTAVLTGILRKSPGIDLIKIGVLTLILTAAASFFIRMNADGILNKKLAKTIITVCYLFSIGFVMMLKHPEILCFWMIGGLTISMLVDSKLGLLLHFNLCFILGIFLSLQPETVIYLLVMGVLMSLLSSSLRQKTSFIYASVILLSTNITLAFVINNFMFDKAVDYNYVSSFFSIFAVLILAFLLGLLYDRKAGIAPEQEASAPTAAKEREQDAYYSSEIDKKSFTNAAAGLVKAAETGPSVREDMSLEKTASEAAEKEEKVLSIASLTAESTVNGITDKDEDTVKETEASKEEEFIQEFPSSEDEVPVYKYFGSRTSYELLNEPGNTLLMKLKESSQSLYDHALRIADISGRAASEVGADVMLAKAGGLYHEIGKINGKNYIEEGIKIANEYSFPKELILIIKQHNIKYDKPTSVEAAIVMLSDNVVSTIEYIEKTEEVKFAPNKIIDNIFQLRMDKGTFDNSGLSLKDFKLLKEFYLKEFSK